MQTSSYTPVSYDFRETIEEQIAKKSRGKIFFFNESNAVDFVEGQVMSMNEIAGQGVFITIEPEATLRIDRIITLHGKPGAAFYEYDAYANQCLSCTGGYEL